MSLNRVTNWIKEELVPQIMKNDDLQESFVQKIEVREIPSMKDNWASDMYEINLLLKQRGKNKHLPLFLKVINKNEKVREAMQSHKQFFNEIHFYSNIVPFLSSQISSTELKKKFEQLLPKCLYTYYNTNKKLENIEDAVLIMENLNVSDFKLGNRTSLDLKHCTLALKRIGFFHAVSYFMKERDLKTFMETIVKPIEETNHVAESREKKNILYDIAERRVIDALAKELPDDDLRLARLRDLASLPAYDVFVNLNQPHEPFSVLCHGDFLRNNILFRYENGEPVDMKLIDFQTIRYASPAIDVFLLLCMNTTHELRISHLDELLEDYHTSLMDSLSSLFKKPKNQLDQRYSFECFLDDFRRHATHGYLISIDFLPRMMVSAEEHAEIFNLYCEEGSTPRFIETARRIGGDRVTWILADLAKDLLNNYFL